LSIEMALDILLIVIIIIVAFPIFWITIAKIIRKMVHFPAPPFIGRMLDSDFRRRQQPPDKVIQRSGIKEGMEVLEVGCGSGCFTTFIARAVGPKGIVYALDISSKMLKQLEKKLARTENRDIRNVKPIKSSAYELPFVDSALDLVYMITVLQEIPDRNRALKEANRVLKQGGILAITELFPDPDYPWKSTTVKLGKQAGFRLEEVSGNFWNYTVRFRKS
jgi:ubiquinone/menaquinone biosynthesis C-methylase UbiE